MLMRSYRFQAELAALVDAALMAVTLTAALITHKFLCWLFPDWFSTFDMFPAHAWIYVLIIPVWSFVLDYSGFYRQPIQLSHLRVWNQAARGGVVSFAVLLGLLYVLKLHSIPRAILTIHAIYTIAAIALRAIYLQPLLLRLEPRRRLILAGSATQAVQLRDWLQETKRSQFFDIIGFLPPAGAPVPEGLPPLGTLDDFSNILHSTVVDAVVFLPYGLPSAVIETRLRQCETEGIEAWLLPNFLYATEARVTLDSMANAPLLLFSTSPKSPWALMIKRALDIILAVIAIILLAPLMLGIAIAIRLSSPGPILFRQRRSTIGGRTFDMYKFRTMIPDAENLREQLEDQNEQTGPVFKIKDDPRIIPVGRWLRRYSLDELPQLWNVLKGDMALVGPRPPIPAEVEKYENWQRRRLSMRSGCTCLWQISGRNELDFDDWMRLDLKYIDTWSLRLDVIILFKTLSAVLRGTGY